MDAQSTCDGGVGFGAEQGDHVGRPLDGRAPRPGRWNPPAAALGGDRVSPDSGLRRHGRIWQNTQELDELFRPLEPPGD
jgi:hypothetical protein